MKVSIALAILLAGLATAIPLVEIIVAEDPEEECYQRFRPCDPSKNQSCKELKKYNCVVYPGHPGV
ncbi:hypothetical protein VF21_10603 [Pseudogymnoascus sp. 05NY08]|nr:hypothetical protein VF21_10603 [Pseudogymnoascus sp. 05NY08]